MNLEQTRPDQDRCRPWTTSDPDHISPPGEEVAEPQENQTRSVLSSRSWTSAMDQVRLSGFCPTPPPRTGLLWSWPASHVHGRATIPVVIAPSVSYAFCHHRNITDDLSVKNLVQTRSLRGSGHLIMLPWRRPRTDQSAMIQSWCWWYFYLFVYLFIF